MYTKIKFILPLLLGLLLVGVLVSYRHYTTTDTTIEIGFIGPLTGNAASFGEIERNILELAVEDINEKGGIHGKKIHIIYEDGKCTGKDAATAAQKLINLDKVTILHVVCSAENLATAPIAEQNHVIQFTAWASNPQISQAGNFIFRNAYSDIDTANIFAEFIYQNHKNIGMLYEKTDYAQGVKETFSNAFTKRGGIINAVGYPQNETEFKVHIIQLLSKKPEAIFLNMDSLGTGIPALKQLRTLGFQGQIYSNVVAGSTDFIQNPLGNDIIFFADPKIPVSEPKQKLFERYKERFGEYPNYEYPAVARYDAMMILAEALSTVGNNPTKIRDYLYNLNEYYGLLGTYSFDRHGDVRGIKPAIKQIINGEIKILQ